MKKDYKDPGECVDIRVYNFLSVAMENTYNMIIGDTTLEELLNEGLDFMPLLCDSVNPTQNDIQNLLKYYEEEEDYEKCSKILNYLKNKK